LLGQSPPALPFFYRIIVLLPPFSLPSFQRDSRFFFFTLPDNRYVLPLSWLLFFFLSCTALACPATSRHSFIGRTLFFSSCTAFVVLLRTKDAPVILRIPAISLSTTFEKRL
jgi:hypothetical protein